MSEPTAPAVSPDGTPWVDSELYRASRLVSGDEFFRTRTMFAAELAGKATTDALLRSVAMAVVAHVLVSEAGTVDSSAVTDAQITAAVATWTAPTPPEVGA